jgi:hypothetical protein
MVAIAATVEPLEDIIVAVPLFLRSGDERR